jgi:hypothetical protein
MITSSQGFFNPKFLYKILNEIFLMFIIVPPNNQKKLE